ncbi:MAG: helix-turn-helix transcriptional regulator [Firmicutes bacterium]|nr:helix-turn-helix transcriptional regulator [Bacillota bacterium]
MTIGERIRFIRKQKNMTIDALAKRIGVTRQTISRYETGAISEIPRSKLEKIAEELTVQYEYLEGWTIDSQCDSTQFDIQQLKIDLVNAKTEDEKAEIESSIEILEESYRDLLFARALYATPSSADSGAPAQAKKRTIGHMIKEWHSDKKANLSMPIDSWLLLALKGMAADSKRSLSDEIEDALYDHVMNAIDEESKREDAILNSQAAVSDESD